MGTQPSATQFPGFRVFELEDGVAIPRGSFVIHAWRRGGLGFSDLHHAQFGYVSHGRVEVRDAHGRYVLTAGMYFSVSDAIEIRPMGDSPGLLLRQPHASCQRTFGGPIEARGRLQYIDACTDSLLLAPAQRGDACLNHLHIPPGTLQTSHFHTSDRVGVIARGSGTCLLPASGDEVELTVGSGWLIEGGVTHHFATSAVDPLDVIAWHPDSETGPSDDDHPMLNRTLVGSGRALRGLRA